ncbi:MAG: methyltransferase domain-containing protein [Deltaproteobacteria bacterium]|nr:methyltransferase domain-containing protein [Deltaproteobacteria bacterium]
MRTLRTFAVGLSLVLAPLGWLSLPGGEYGPVLKGFSVQAQEGGLSKKIVPFVPTPQDVVERMLELAQVKKGDVVYDLGSGDGRIVIAAAKKYGVKAVGFEIDPELIKQSRENIRKEGLGNLAEIREQDILTVDLSPATVLTMYLLPDVNLKLRPNILKQLRPGSRVVSHDFDMGDWKPAKVERIKDKSDWEHTIYLWQVGERQPR